MSLNNWLWPLALTLALSGCEAPEPSAQINWPALASFTVQGPQALAEQRWDGVIQARQQALLSAQTTGRIEQIGVDVGHLVSAGQLLIKISAVEQNAARDAANAELNAARAAADEARSTYQRYSQLAKQQLVSAMYLEQLRARRDATLARQRAAQAQLQQAQRGSSYTEIHAPFAGLISQRWVEPGESIQTGQSLVALYNPDQLRIEVDLPQSVAELIRPKLSARIELADGQVLTPQQALLFPKADEQSHSVRLRLELPPLRQPPAPGTTASVLIQAPDAGPASLWIARSAVSQRGELSAVYVLQEDGKPLLRQLRLGAVQGDQVEVISGLATGERIAQDPSAAQQILAAQRQGAQP